MTASASWQRNKRHQHGGMASAACSSSAHQRMAYRHRNGIGISIDIVCETAWRIEIISGIENGGIMASAYQRGGIIMA